jgi:Na+-driven multidrug efflux pump
VIRVPGVWLFAVYCGGGSTVAWIIMSASQAVNGFMLIRMFKAGKWKEKSV